MIERGIQNAPLHAHLAFKRNQMVPYAVIDYNVALDLHIDGKVCVSEQAVHFAQRWNTDVLIAFHAV